MKNRIREIRQEKRLTLAKVAEAAGTTPSTVRKLEVGEMELNTRWMTRIAAALGVAPADLLRESDSAPSPFGRAFPADVPVRGTAAGSGLAEGAMLLDQQEPVAWVQRPPGIAMDREVYALHVKNSSMEPRYMERELIYVCPNRRPRPGDHVVLICRNHRAAAREAFVKRLVRENGEWIITAQYNPPAEIKFARAQIEAIHRVLTLNELFGI